MIDTRNNTYQNKEKFLKDKEKIIDILSKEIDIKLYNLDITKDKMILTLKKEEFHKNISSLSKQICNNSLYPFHINYEWKDYTTISKTNNSIFEIDEIETIDKDIYSKYYPIKLETSIINIWISNDAYQKEDTTNILTLLKAYSREYFIENPLTRSLIYSEIK